MYMNNKKLNMDMKKVAEFLNDVANNNYTAVRPSDVARMHFVVNDAMIELDKLQNEVQDIKKAINDVMKLAEHQVDIFYDKGMLSFDEAEFNKAYGGNIIVNIMKNRLNQGDVLKFDNKIDTPSGVRVVKLSKDQSDMLKKLYSTKNSKHDRTLEKDIQITPVDSIIDVFRLLHSIRES